MNPTTTLDWSKPGRGAWRLDSAHTLGPVTPVIQQILPGAMAAGFRSFTDRYGLPISHIDVRYVNGFAYGSVRVAGIPPSDGPPPPPQVLRVITRLHPVFRRRNRNARRALADRVWTDDLHRWFDDVRPGQIATMRTLQAVDPEQLDAQALAAHVEHCSAALAAGLREHFSLVGASAVPVGLYVLQESAVGRSPELAIADLAGAAAASTGATVPALAAVAAALTAAGVTPTTLDDVRRASADAAAALDAYLAEYGERVVGAFDVTGRRLSELPEVILRSVLAVGRRGALPAPLEPAVDPVADDARLAIASRDDHAGICCMWPLGLLRRALLAAGERIHTSGSLHDRDHVLQCTVPEVGDLLLGRLGAPTASEVADREAHRGELAQVTPPALLGVDQPPPDPSVFPAALGRMTAAMGAFLGTMDAAPSGRPVGIGQIVHRGRAVVALDPEDAIARLEPGDVLVTRTTTPAFNCVLPIAGALVTVHGGPMSHAGIAARELGISAVVGLADALDRIVDGAEVDVDPIAGSVRTAPAFVEFGPGVRSPKRDYAQVGGKAAGLLTMRALGLPVPPGAVLPVALHGATAHDGELDRAVRAALLRVEALAGRRLGDPVDPLLVSVRSGAAVSMPGMMDTLLNVGMTPDVAAALARATGDAAFADDTYRRFLAGWATAVEGMSAATVAGAAAGSRTASELANRLSELGCSVPTDPVDQVIAATRAVYRSWNSERAVAFRQRDRIDDGLGTAAIIQAMVFGNLDAESASGVAFSRDPSTGAPGVVADVVFGAQGDDVVGGARSTESIGALADRMPSVHRELLATMETLERHHRDVVDVEFTVERARLFLLQCRRGVRSAAAQLRLTVDMADDPHFPLERAEAVERCRQLADAASVVARPLPAAIIADHRVADGIPASPGRAVGVVAVSVDDALRRHALGQRVVLVRPTTSPADVAAMAVASAVVTASGGAVSHAALVARAWGVPAVVGVNGLLVDEAGVSIGGRRFDAGAVVTVDGTAGLVLEGAHSGEAAPPPELAVLRRWAAELPELRSVVADHAGDGRVEPLDVLRLVVLRGRTDTGAVAAGLEAGAEAVHASLGELVAEGFVEVDGATLRATTAGRDRVRAEVADTVAAHGAEFAELLGRFGGPDRALKQIVTAHQLRPAETTAADAARRIDAEVLSVADAVIATAAAITPRFARYRSRLDAALARVAAGDERYLAHPAVDSMHTVWFELHEELIALAGAERSPEPAIDR